jgi:hypothetical protein
VRVCLCACLCACLCVWTAVEKGKGFFWWSRTNFAILIPKDRNETKKKTSIARNSIVTFTVVA